MREWEKALPELIEEALSMARKRKLSRKENSILAGFIAVAERHALPAVTGDDRGKG
jgi:hypothetical protein